MSDYTPETGHRVRVVLEGEVMGGVPDEGTGVGWFTVGGGRYGNTIHDDAEHVVSVERLPDPEPEWQLGDVAVCAQGATYMRTERGWIGPRCGAHLLHDERCHLTLLVRDGKPVTP